MIDGVLNMTLKSVKNKMKFMNKYIFIKLDDQLDEF